MQTANSIIYFRETLKFWIKLGFISFGGPAGQVAIMHQEVVERQKWMGENQFLRALNFCIGHGNPVNALSKNNYTEGWASISKSIPRPKAILSVSAHYYIPLIP